MERAEHGGLAPLVWQEAGAARWQQGVAWRERARLVEDPEREIVKIGHRIGFGPESDPAAGIRRVAGTEQDGLVENGFDFAAPLHDTKCMPTGGGERAVELLYNLLDPVHDAIDAYLLLHQTRSQEIVVPVVLRPPQQPAAEVGLSRHGEIGDLDIDIAALGTVEQNDFMRLIRPFGLQLGEHLRRTLCAVGDEDFPFAGRSAVELRADDVGAWQHSR